MFQANTVGLLLAAGKGLRYDPTGAQNKLTYVLKNGAPVAVQAAQNLQTAVARVIAVVSSSTVAQQLADVGCEVHFFGQAQLGMGASLAFAMSQVVDANVVLVTLADMPFVQTQTYGKVVNALVAGADIVQPVYQKTPGHPIGFSKRHFPALMALSGDIGARHLLREFPVHQIEVDDEGILRDIDFQVDL